MLRLEVPKESWQSFDWDQGKDNQQYEGAGVNETVYWDIEWISEDEIRLYVPGDRWTEVKQSVVQQRCHNSI